MSMFKVVLSKRFCRDIQKIDQVVRDYVLSHLDRLAQGDKNLDIKKLQPKHSGYYRLRIGKYRIIFTYITDNQICILKIDNRDSVYLNLSV